MHQNNLKSKELHQDIYDLQLEEMNNLINCLKAQLLQVELCLIFINLYYQNLKNLKKLLQMNFLSQLDKIFIILLFYFFF